MLLNQEELKSMAGQLTELFTIKVEQQRSDRLLNKADLAKKLGCSRTDVERKYLSRPDFPRLKSHIDGVRDMYSDIAVDKWIAENQTIN